jgi:hypothetical protein
MKLCPYCPYFMSDLGKIRYKSPYPLSICEFRENRWSGSHTLRKGIHEVLPFLHFSSDLDKIRYRRCPQTCIEWLSITRKSVQWKHQWISIRTDLHLSFPPRCWWDLRSSGILRGVISQKSADLTYPYLPHLVCDVGENRYKRCARIAVVHLLVSWKSS